MLQCFVFSVEQCQQSEVIPSSVNQATLSRDFQVFGSVCFNFATRYLSWSGVR